MAEYHINKGVGKGAEFKGLKAQYLYLFAGGMLGSFLLFIVIYVMGVPIAACITIILVVASLILYYVFRMNREYGEHGLMKRAAKNAEPRVMYQTGKLCRRIRKNTEERKKGRIEERKTV
jgi:hypothetical protein